MHIESMWLITFDTYNMNITAAQSRNHPVSWNN